MLRTVAKILGVVLLAVGVLGFFEPATPDGHLLGIFEVNGVHNVIHIASGAAALWAGMTSAAASRRYFQIFGVVYGLVTLLGLVYGEDPILGIIAHNTADIFLHIVISGLALFLGFGSYRDDRAVA